MVYGGVSVYNKFYCGVYVSVNSVVRVQDTVYLYLGQENDCVTATSQIYAHKKRPSVFIQEYRIHNPSVGN